MADMTFNTPAGQVVDRKLLILYLNTGTNSAPVWSPVGKRVEESSMEYDYSEESKTDIFGEIYTNMKKPVITQSFEPCELDSGDAAQVKIWNQSIKEQNVAAMANNDLLVVHAYAGTADTAVFAERYESCMVKPASLGGSSNVGNCMFSENSNDRILHRSDFHLPKDILPDEMEQQSLYIEAVFEFEELQSGSNGGEYAIPIFFQHFVVDNPGRLPYLRIRLEATWEKSNTIDGSIDSKISYITCPEFAEIEEGNRTNASRRDLDKIRVIYVPAVRDPSKQLKNASGMQRHNAINEFFDLLQRPGIAEVKRFQNR